MLFETLAFVVLCIEFLSFLVCFVRSLCECVACLLPVCIFAVKLCLKEWVTQ